MKVHPMTGYDVRTPPGVSGASSVAVRRGGSTGKVGSFGMTRNGGTKMHKGVDWLCIPGRPIFAAMDGKVKLAGESVPLRGTIQDGRKGYGYRVTLGHAVTGDGKKVETRYAHLAAVFVTVGEIVRAGQCLGLAGRSGNVDHDIDTHLHFEVRINGNPLDPEHWIKP